MSRPAFFNIVMGAGSALILAAVLAGCNRHEDPVSPAKNKGQDAELTVFKSAQCHCCQRWIEHLEANGFKVNTKETGDLRAVKQRFGIEPQDQSCHTAVSAGGDYVFEGHIPADIIRRFLRAPPTDAVGLTVPGMPPGSPGMETGGSAPPYDVLVLEKGGAATVYATVDPQSPKAGE